MFEDFSSPTLYCAATAALSVPPCSAVARAWCLIWAWRSWLLKRQVGAARCNNQATWSLITCNSTNLQQNCGAPIYMV